MMNDSALFKMEYFFVKLKKFKGKLWQYGDPTVIRSLDYSFPFYSAILNIRLPSSRGPRDPKWLLVL